MNSLLKILGVPGTLLWVTLATVLPLAAQAVQADDRSGPPVKNHPISNPLRRELMAQYLLTHAGTETWELKDPQMIVVHDTETRTLEQTFAMFDHDRLESDRPEIAGGGPVNVGIHFIIDTDGTIWSLLPENEAGRHTIGFNHTALGIEMVAPTPGKLNMAQLEACTALVRALAARHPSVKYLIGHFEYMDQSLPHFALRKELDATYGPTKKTDPGPVFMEALRARLAQHWQLVFLP